jgi:hypothetical protein
MVKPIIGSAFSVTFDTRATVLMEPSICTGEDLMNSLAAKGYIGFDFLWQECFSTILPIEDDVIFICDAACELADFTAGQGAHYVHLGDGALVIDSELHEEVVTIDVTHNPHLHPGLERSYTFTTPVSNYVRAWWSVVRQLRSRATQ